MAAGRTPITQVPVDYREIRHLVLTNPATLALLNVLSLALIVPFFVLMLGWILLVLEVRGPLTTSALENVPGVIYWLAVIGVLPLHELVHGIAIRWTGHRPRYGWKTVGLGPIRVPVVLFATADDAYFHRDDFVVIALAPAVAITLGAMLLIPLLPDALHVYVAVAVILNGSGAIGDFWMTAVVLRYPQDSLVRDEADAIRVYIYDPDWQDSETTS